MKTHVFMNPSERGPIGKYRWFICALLFFATTINYVDRQILALIKPTLDDVLKWSNQDYGLVNSYFQAAYAVGLLIFGKLVDRYGTKVGYTLSIAGWSLAAVAHALVSTVFGFKIARVGLGVPEGGNFPSAIKAVALWFPKRERAFATSLFNAGTNVGAIVAPALVPWLLRTWGWQSAFVVAGIAGFCWLFLWIPFYQVPEKTPRLTAEELAHINSDKDEAGGQSTKMGWLDVLGYRQTWSFVIGKFLTDPVWWFFLIWLPDYFKKTRHLDIKTSWKHLVTVYVIVTVLSIFGGWVTGHLNRRGWSVTRARKTGMFIFSLCVLPILFATKVGDWAAVLIIGVAMSAHQAFSANIYTTVSDMFPKKAVASVIGIGGMAGSVGGMIFPIVAGALLDKFTKLGNVTAGYAILFGFCGFAYVVAFGVNHLFAPKYEQLVERNTMGRLRRRSYFVTMLILSVVAAALVTAIRSVQGGEAGTILSAIIGLCALVAAAYFAVRRLYDLERPAWHFLLLLIPVYGLYVQAVLLFKRGTVGPNLHGADPVRN
jgi:ACS family hexuronate transporter-like MFS transporter